MTPQEYYASVIDKIKKSFRSYHYLVAAGRELLADGWDPRFLVAVAPIDQLEKYTLIKGMQVHLPVVGERSQSVLMPLDFEVFLAGENKQLYTDRDAQYGWMQQILPVCRFVEKFFREKGIPYLLDYTPSGAHILWQNPIDSRATKAITAIGYLEEDLIKACRYKDENDIKRRWGISLEAAGVFSGLGKLAEYVSLITIRAFKDNESTGGLPVTISDSIDRCVNFDISWAEGSPFMRSIRSPFSLHKKNHDVYKAFHLPPLVDVIGTWYDGENLVEQNDLNTILDCMWDLQKAAEHSRQFSGVIPISNDNLIDFVEEYKKSPLCEFHQEFENEKDLPRFEALSRVKKDPNLTDFARNILNSPNPLALQPKNMMGFVTELLLEAEWKPKHIANIFRDLYVNPEYKWHIDFFKYPAEEKANFWARAFSALVLMKANRLNV